MIDLYWTSRQEEKQIDLSIINQVSLVRFPPSAVDEQMMRVTQHSGELSSINVVCFKLLFFKFPLF